MTKKKRTKTAAAKKKKPAKKMENVKEKEVKTVTEEFLPDDKKEDQQFLFGEADMILNTLEMELKDWKDQLSKLHAARDRVENKLNAAEIRIQQLQKATAAAAKHAPKTEEPAPPMKEAVKEAVQKEVEKTNITDSDVGKMLNEAEMETMEEPEPDEEMEGIRKGSKMEGTDTGEEEESEEEGPEVQFRQPRGPTVPEILKRGDTIREDPSGEIYRVELIEGPFYQAQVVKEEGEDPELIKTPGFYKLSVSALDAPRMKSGELSKGYNTIPIPFLIGKDGRILCVFSDSEQEVSSTIPKAEETEEEEGEAIREEEDEDEDEDEDLKDEEMF